MWISCKKAGELSSKELDEGLTTLEQLQLRFHLAMCRACRGFHRQVQALQLVTRIIFAAEAVDVELLEQLENSLSSAVLSEGAKDKLRLQLKMALSEGQTP